MKRTPSESSVPVDSSVVKNVISQIDLSGTLAAATSTDVEEEYQAALLANHATLGRLMHVFSKTTDQLCEKRHGSGVIPSAILLDTLETEYGYTAYAQRVAEGQTGSSPGDCWITYLFQRTDRITIKNKLSLFLLKQAMDGIIDQEPNKVVISLFREHHRRVATRLFETATYLFVMDATARNDIDTDKM